MYFPLIILITGFTNMFGMGGIPLFSMAAGAGKKDMARDIQNTSFVLLIISAVVLMVIGDIWAGPILDFLELVWKIWFTPNPILRFIWPEISLPCFPAV